MLKLPIYLDNHATTPVDPRVLEAMLPYLTHEFGNAASRSHPFGWRAEAAVEVARRQVADLIGCAENEIVFTSGATESDNLAIKGIADAYRSRGDHIVTVKTEHKAVLDSCKHLERLRVDRIDELRRIRVGQLAGTEVTFENLEALTAAHDVRADHAFKLWASNPGTGARISYLGVDRDGRIDLDELKRTLEKGTVLVSVMLANNEIGTLQPVKEIGAMCRESGIVFHCDAVQGLGKVPFRVDEVNADLVSITAHKMYGPKGVGALYVRRKPRVRLSPIIDGGGHERGMRSGTLNVPGIVGLGKAAELARLEMPEESRRILGLREKLRHHLIENLDGVWLNGSLEHRLPGNLNVSFDSIDGDALMQVLRDVAVSSGAACTSASLESSYVLRACGLDEMRANGSIRFGIGRFNTGEEVDFAAGRVVEAVRRLRAGSPLVPGAESKHRAAGGPVNP